MFSKIKHSFIVLFIVSTLALNLSCQEPEAGDTPGINEITATESALLTKDAELDKSVILGRWTRSDAEYTIEIAELYANGKIKAGYYNPNPINVGDTRWNKDAGAFKIFIELRDVNYPGSKYDLTYDTGKNMLTGNYYQAVEGRSYKVEFNKSK